MLDEQEILATRVLNGTATWNEIQAFIDKNYVKKDKIKEKIDYLDNEGYWDYLTNRDRLNAKELLEELLKEKE